MNLEINEEHTLILNSVERYFIRQSGAADGQCICPDAEEWRELGRMGLLEHLVQEPDGEQHELVAQLLVARKFGETLAVSPLIESIMAGCLLSLPDNPDAALVLAGLTSGNCCVAFAELDAEVPTVISETGEKCLLSGSKRSVRWGVEADYFLVKASRAQQPTLCLVHRDNVTVNRSTKFLDQSLAASLSFEDVELHEGHFLNLREDQVSVALDRGKLLAAAQLIGIMARVLEETKGYVQQRVQFGRRIAEAQAVQHMIARMFIALEQSESALLRASLPGIGEEDGCGGVDAMFRFVSRAAMTVGETAIQLHGGMGITEELLVSRAHRQIVLLSHRCSSWA